MFRLLGFDVHVRPGFVMFMLLIVVLIGGAHGVWLAGALAGFTLLHELGHALAARRAGAQAEISLNFLAGYASYVPTRPLSRAERAWISFAGPAIQIAVSLAILVAMGVNPLQPETFDSSPAAWAIWWAGPVIGLFNLLPILPLDGGHIVTTGFDRLLPGRAVRPMLWFSIAVTGAAAIAVLVADRYRGFALVVGFVLVMQLQMLGSDKEPVSPWRAAADALAAGRTGKARRLLVGALSQPHLDRQPPKLDLTAAEARAVIDVLPEPLPRGDPWNEYVLANLLIVDRRYEDAAHYAADSYHRHPHTLVAATVARAAAALGDQATAIGWLRTAAEANTSAAGLATPIGDDLVITAGHVVEGDLRRLVVAGRPATVAAHDAALDLAIVAVDHDEPLASVVADGWAKDSDSDSMVATDATTDTITDAATAITRTVATATSDTITISDTDSDSDSTVATAMTTTTERVTIVTADGARHAVGARAITLRVDDLDDGEVYERPALRLATDVAPGDSGAPVLDADGALVGVVTLRRASDDGSYATSLAPLPALLERARHAIASDDGLAPGPGCV